MSDRVEMRITARDEASDDLQRVGRNAQRMGQDVERGGRDAERGMRGFATSARNAGNALDEVGTAVGVVVGGMAILGRNARDHEREVDAIRRAYGDSADSVIAFSESLQDATNFSNDAAREAALVAATLTREYGLTGEQAQELVARSADLAAVFGVSLTDATERLAGAVRGEAEAAERLGIAVSDTAVASYAAAEGYGNWNTITDESIKGQVRFQAIMEQSTYAVGAAGDQAQGAAGRAQDFVHWLDDTGEAAGRMLGPVGESLSVMGNVALAAPLAGNALGRMAQGLGTVAGSARTAAIAGSLLNVAFGPVGLVAAAAAGIYALHKLRGESEDYGISAEDAATGTTTLADAIYRLADAGASVGEIDVARIIADQTDELLRLSSVTFGAPTAFQAQGERIVAGMLAANEAAIASGEEVRFTLGEVEAVWDDVEVAMAEYAFTAEQAGAVTDDLATIIAHTGENQSYLLRLVEEANQDYRNGRIDAETYARRIDDIANGAERLGVALPTATDATSTFRDTAEGLVDTLGAWSAEIERQAEAQAAHAAGLADVTAATDAAAQSAREHQAAVEGDVEAERARTTAIIESRDAALSANRVYDDSVAQLSEIAGANAEATRTTLDLQAGYLAVGDAAGIAAFQQGLLTGEITESEGSLRRLTEAEDILIARREAGIALSAEEEAFLGRVDAQQADLTETIEDNTVALGLQESALLAGEEAGDSLAGSIDDLSSVMGDLVDTIRELNGLPPLEDTLTVPESAVESWRDLGNAAADALGQMQNAENRRAEANALQANASMLLGLGSLFAPANQPPPSGQQPGALPVDRTIVEPRLGEVVIPVTIDPSQATATLRVIEGDIADVTDRSWVAAITGDASGAIRAVSEAEGELADVTGATWLTRILGDASGALGGVQATHNALSGINGRSATVNVFADTSVARNQINALTGYQGDAVIHLRTVNVGPAPFAAGGIVPHAADGMIVRAGEVGGEMVYPPGGSPWLAARDGLYVMESGSYVQTAPATRAAGGGGSRVELHFHGQINVRDGRDFGRQVRGYLEGIG